MPTKQAAKVAKAFLGVMTRFGACAEVLTDNGTEFPGEFEQLCQKLFLDYRWTLRYHPQSNGLTKRLVRTIKMGITKYKTENDRRTWDEWLPYLVMGYRMSNQAALGPYSPYYLMHGRQPLMTGAAAKQLLGEPIDFDEPEQWVGRASSGRRCLGGTCPRPRGTTGGAAPGPEEVRAREESGVPTAGAEICSGGLGLPPPAAGKQHQRVRVERCVQGASSRGGRAHGAARGGRDGVQGAHGELRPVPQPQHQHHRRSHADDNTGVASVPSVQEGR
jgi:hypothetical protein